MSNKIVWLREETQSYIVSDAAVGDVTKAQKLMTDEQRNKLSRFMSWALRHEPNKAGLDMGSHGWVNAYSLTKAAEEQYDWVTPEHIAAVVSLDEKGRYEVQGNQIRAVYGHSDSLNVTIENNTDESNTIPDTLYHGTTTDKATRIKIDGLRPMSRNKVHLTDDVETATDTGFRHGDNVTVFKVSVDCLNEQGYQVTKRGDEVFVTPYVPPDCLEVHNRY